MNNLQPKNYLLGWSIKNFFYFKFFNKGHLKTLIDDLKRNSGSFKHFIVLEKVMNDGGIIEKNNSLKDPREDIINKIKLLPDLVINKKTKKANLNFFKILDNIIFFEKLYKNSGLNGNIISPSVLILLSYQFFLLSNYLGRQIVNNFIMHQFLYLGRVIPNIFVLVFIFFRLRKISYFKDFFLAKNKHKDLSIERFFFEILKYKQKFRVYLKNQKNNETQQNCKQRQQSCVYDFKIFNSLALENNNNSPQINCINSINSINFKNIYFKSIKHNLHVYSKKICNLNLKVKNFYCYQLFAESYIDNLLNIIYHLNTKSFNSYSPIKTKPSLLKKKYNLINRINFVDFYAINFLLNQLIYSLLDYVFISFFKANKTNRINFTYFTIFREIKYKYVDSRFFLKKNILDINNNFYKDFKSLVINSDFNKNHVFTNLHNIAIKKYFYLFFNVYFSIFDKKINDIIDFFIKNTTLVKKKHYRNLNYIFHNSVGKTLYYIRHNNQIFLGFYGSKKEFLIYNSKISDFLKKKIFLFPWSFFSRKSILNVISLQKNPIFLTIFLLSKNLKKIFKLSLIYIIKNALTEKIFFLNTEILLVFLNLKKKFRKFNYTRFLNLYIDKNNSRFYYVYYNYYLKCRSVMLLLPISFFLKKLVEQGFIKIEKNNYIPQSLGKLIHYKTFDILLFYKKIINNICNFYIFINNKYQIQLIFYFMRLSCALTLARKLKLKTINKVFKKFSTNLNITDGKKNISLKKYLLRKYFNPFKQSNFLIEKLRKNE